MTAKDSPTEPATHVPAVLAGRRRSSPSTWSTTGRGASPVSRCNDAARGLPVSHATTSITAPGCDAHPAARRGREQHHTDLRARGPRAPRAPPGPAWPRPSTSPSPCTSTASPAVWWCRRTPLVTPTRARPMRVPTTWSSTPRPSSSALVSVSPSSVTRGGDRHLPGANHQRGHRQRHRCRGADHAAAGDGVRAERDAVRRQRVAQQRCRSHQEHARGVLRRVHPSTVEQRGTRLRRHRLQSHCPGRWTRLQQHATAECHASALGKSQRELERERGGAQQRGLDGPGRNVPGRRQPHRLRRDTYSLHAVAPVTIG